MSNYRFGYPTVPPPPLVFERIWPEGGGTVRLICPDTLTNDRGDSADNLHFQSFYKMVKSKLNPGVVLSWRRSFVRKNCYLLSSDQLSFPANLWNSFKWTRSSQMAQYNSESCDQEIVSDDVKHDDSLRSNLTNPEKSLNFHQWGPQFGSEASQPQVVQKSGTPASLVCKPFPTMSYT